MTYEEKIDKVLTSGKTAGEILAELKLLSGIRQLRRDIEETQERFSMKLDSISKSLDSMNAALIKDKDAE